jgi:WS/DGAT/MGAT family acyltransferase
MDRPINRMMITGVMTFDRPLDAARLKRVTEERFLCHRRFRQRVRHPRLPLGLPEWEDDPHFDLDTHLPRIALPQPGDICALQELVSDLMSLPVDYTRPLWRFYIVENFGLGGALIARLHHCLADGLALVQVLLSETDPEPDPDPAVALNGRPDTRALRARMQPCSNHEAPALTPATHGTELLLHEGIAMLQHPTHALKLAGLAKANAAALAKLVLTPPDRRTLFNRKPAGSVKRAAWTEPIPLADAKAIAHQFGATVNDVLLAAVAGALRRYLEARQQPTEGLNVRAMVPVSIRQPEEMGKLGNRFGLVILSLPVGVREPVERLAILKERMDAIKHSPEAFVAFGILGVMGMTPVDVEKIIVDIFCAKVSAVMTNVPGPKEPLYLAGSRLESIMFWVPTGGDLGMGISILSYAGNVLVGIATDVLRVPDPGAIVMGFQDEIAALRGWIKPDGMER